MRDGFQKQSAGQAPSPSQDSALLHNLLRKGLGNNGEAGGGRMALVCVP